MTPYFARLAERSVGRIAAAPRRADADGWGEQHEEQPAASSSTIIAPFDAAPIASASTRQIASPPSLSETASRQEQVIASKAPATVSVPHVTSAIDSAPATRSAPMAFMPRSATADGAVHAAAPSMPEREHAVGNETQPARALTTEPMRAGAADSKQRSATPVARTHDVHAAAESARDIAAAAARPEPRRPGSLRPAPDRLAAATTDRLAVSAGMEMPAQRAQNAVPAAPVRAQPAAATATVPTKPAAAASVRSERTAAVSVHIGRVDVEIVGTPPRPPVAPPPTAPASPPPKPAAAFNPRRHYLRSG